MDHNLVCSFSYKFVAANRVVVFDPNWSKHWHPLVSTRLIPGSQIPRMISKPWTERSVLGSGGMFMSTDCLVPVHLRS